MAYEFSENIQRGILFLLKSKKDFYLQIINLVEPDYFEFPSHSNIFSVVKNHYGKYHSLPTDDFILESLRGSISRREDIADYEDELSYVNSLDTSAIENPDYYMDLIEAFAKKEAMKKAIQECIILTKQDKIEETEAVVRKALTVARTVDIGQNYFSGLKDRWDRTFNEEHKDKYSTVLNTLDRSLDGGLNRKELAMVVAPPGVGKSLYLVNQGVKALMEDRKVLYVSLEMSEDKIAQRFDSVMTLITQQRLKNPDVQIEVKNRLDLFKSNFGKGSLVIKEFPTGQATVNTLRALLVQLRNFEDFVPDLIIVDYLELLRPTRDIQQEYQAQQRVSEDLRGLSMEMNILVWTATQTNRLGRNVKIITDSELGDSYGKIRTCDFAVSLNQTEEEFDNQKMRVYVMKSRNGKPRFIVPMHVDYNTLRMKEFDGDDE